MGKNTNSITGMLYPLIAIVVASPAMATDRISARVALESGTVNRFQTVADFDSVVVAQTQITPVIIDFYASWCGPCKRFEPTLYQLAKEYSGKLTFLRVEINRDFNDPLARRFSVKSIPMLVVIAKDQPPGLVSGAQPIGELREIFQSYLVGRSIP